MNISKSLFPYKKGFVTSNEFSESDRIFTLAIGSNNNINDWENFIDKNINNTIITKQNTTGFKQCLQLVGEGILDDYYLSFLSYSFKRGGWGIASLKHNKGSRMRGNIFELVADDTITKKKIVSLIRWKEDFPTLYKEIIVPVRGNDNKLYNCLVYIINTPKKITDINKTFPSLPLPPSSYYIGLIIGTNCNRWKGITERIMEKGIYHRKRFVELIECLYSKYIDPVNKPTFGLLRYIGSHYKNEDYRSYKFTKGNDIEIFKIHTLMACQCLVFYLNDVLYDKEVLNIIDNITDVELKSLINIIRMLFSWDNKIKNIQH
jgi:hypothetical protein